MLKFYDGLLQGHFYIFTWRTFNQTLPGETAPPCLELTKFGMKLLDPCQRSKRECCVILAGLKFVKMRS